jgi:endonuclease/exonuclease/phosphatase family metal-dependent hydrolase
MKKIIRSAWIIYCFFLIPAFLASCCTAFIPPVSFSYITLFALAFPYLFVLVLVSAFITIYIKKKLAMALVISLLPGLYNLAHTVAFNISPDAKTPKNDSTLRIMTWNVQYFVDLTERSAVSSKMLNLIKEKDPDIVCMQECANVEGGKKRFSVRHKMDSLGYPYYFFSNDEVYINRKGVFVTEGTMLFSKIPFTDSGRINITNTPATENLIYVDINFNNKPLRIYTAHLISFALFRDTVKSDKDIYEITYSRKRDIEYKLRKVEQLHQKEVEIIRSEIEKNSLPAVYCGDMNAVPCSYNYHALKNIFQDAFLEKGSGTGVTFYKLLPTLRIDYCFTDKRFRIINCTVINKKLADHYPVLTDIKWK